LPVVISVPLAGLGTNRPVRVQDPWWQKEELDGVNESVSASVSFHGAVLWRLQPVLQAFNYGPPRPKSINDMNPRTTHPIRPVTAGVFLLLSTLALVLAAASVRAADAVLRPVVPLDEWRFALDEDASGPAGPAFVDGTWETVTLPHTWNVFDGEGGGRGYHRGTGWYRTRFSLPPVAEGRRVVLEFDAASQTADVFINGRKAGTHIGSFARFRFDVTESVSLTNANLLAVRVSNARNDFLPRAGDFTMFGGLYRRARVLLTAPVHIATLDHASPGVRLMQRQLSSERADVEACVKFANDSAGAFSGSVRVTVRTDGGQEVASSSAPVEIAAHGSSETVLPITIAAPRFWDGVSDPAVYRVVVELLAGGRVLDAVEQPLGLRTIAIKPDQGLFLNGRRIAVRGVNRHQDRLDQGWAIHTNDMAGDFALIRELGANAVRLAHYQHDSFFHDLCDGGGVLVWAEVCFVNDPPQTPDGRDNARQQLRELIRQNFNHPAIFCWGIGNETSGDNAAAESLLRELNTVVHEEDPTRPSTYASHHHPGDRRNFITDIVAVNKYFGWYEQTYSGLGEWLDAFHAAHPDVTLGISEYGAGASIYQHEADPPIRKSQAWGPWHPEEWQTRFHEENWLQIQARPWIWGTFIWCMFDFASDGRNEGDTSGRNDKGLVTMDRRTRKDAFFWYQAQWTTNPMVHIVSKRFTERSQPGTRIRVYSNGDQVEARLNGVSLGKQSSADRRFVWPDITLRPGVNRVEVVAWRGGRPVATDSVAWNFRADGTPLPNKPVAEKENAP
jgi:beta-galactosidase